MARVKAFAYLKINRESNTFECSAERKCKCKRKKCYSGFPVKDDSATALPGCSASIISRNGFTFEPRHGSYRSEISSSYLTT
jgi:hypothetical protein